MQVARTAAASAAAMAAPGGAPARTTRGFADLQRVHERIKAQAEQLVDLCHHPAQLGAIKVALHHVHHILHQEVTLYLHDGRGRRADEAHDEIVAGLFLAVGVYAAALATFKFFSA